MMEAKEENKEETVAFDIEIKTDSEKRLMGYAAAVSQSCKLYSQPTQPTDHRPPQNRRLESVLRTSTG